MLAALGGCLEIRSLRCGFDNEVDLPPFAFVIGGRPESSPLVEELFLVLHSNSDVIQVCCTVQFRQVGVYLGKVCLRPWPRVLENANDGMDREVPPSNCLRNPSYVTGDALVVRQPFDSIHVPTLSSTG